MKKSLNVILLVFSTTLLGGCSNSSDSGGVVYNDDIPTGPLFNDDEKDVDIFDFPEDDDRHASAYTGYKIYRDSNTSTKIGWSLASCDEDNVVMASVWYEDNYPVVAVGDGIWSIRQFPYGYNSVRDYGSSLYSIKLSKNLRYINDNAFYNCTGLSSINIPEGCISIGTDSFKKANLRSGIYLPSTLQSIGTSAFFSSSITSIFIPASVTSIGENAFVGCSNLTTIYCEASSKPSGWSQSWNYKEISSYDALAKKYDVVWNATR